MRNFDERMDAIRSRSKARIARRRKQIGAVCVPLVLCLAISCLWFIPNQGQTTALENTELVSSPPTNVTIVLYESTGNVLSCANTGDAVLEFISTLDPNSGRNQSATPHYTIVYDVAGAVKTSTDELAVQAATFTISVVDSLGVKHTYTYVAIWGELTDTANGKVYYLNSAERIQFESLFGLQLPTFD